MLTEDNRELYKEIKLLEKEQRKFRRRISAVLNMFVPGLGFFIYNGNIIKAVVTFGIYSSYIYCFARYIYPMTDIQWFYSIPIGIIWLVSTIMVAEQQ